MPRPRTLISVALAALTVASLACSTPTSVQAQDSFDAGLVCPIVPVLMDRYLANHTVFEKESDALRKRVVDAYLSNLDPNELMLTESEFAAVKKDVEKLVKSVRDGECTSFEELKKDRIAWAQDMVGFASEMLAEDVAIDPTIKLQLDPDKRDRPTTDAERDDLRTRLIHFQLANYTQAGLEMKEAREKVVARYERQLKRIQDLEETDLYTEFLNAYARALDPHSSYFSADDLEDFRISMELSLEGIGAVLRSEDGFTIINEVVVGGAAARQGSLQPEDKIIAVAQGKDGEPVTTIDMELRDVVRMIRGEKGTQVKLTVLRQGEQAKTFDIVITRDKIALEEQAAKIRWETRTVDGDALKLAVIELPSFYGGRDNPTQATDDVRKLLEEAKKGDADGVLLDLSRNGGGLLSAAVDIAGLFIGEGPIVGVSGRIAPTKYENDTDDSVSWSGPLVVLTSRVSASASEIVAGALQDYERAVIVGDEQTFGKGTVQQVDALPPGLGALKVTMAKFYLPEGESTQFDGVAADVVVPSAFDIPEIGERSQDNALLHSTIDAFEGKDANPKKGGYEVVTKGIIADLAERSAKRVAKDEALAEIAERLKKRIESDGELVISEVLENDEEDDLEENEDDDDDDDALSPQALEGVNVLADLVVAQRN